VPQKEQKLSLKLFISPLNNFSFLVCLVQLLKILLWDETERKMAKIITEIIKDNKFYVTAKT
jgi:hypothetical protein